MRKAFKFTIVFTVLHLLAFYLLKTDVLEVDANGDDIVGGAGTLTVTDRVAIIFCDLLWALCQMLRSINIGGGKKTDDLETLVFDTWERILRFDAGGNSNVLLPIKVYDARNFDPTSPEIDLDKPFIVTNNDYDAEEELALTSENMMNLSELSSIEIDYFHDATTTNTVPDSVDTIGPIVARVLREDAPHKFGTQKIFQRHPDLLHRIVKPYMRTIWGDRFRPCHLGLTLTVPTFFAKGRGDGGNDGTTKRTTRTDLHAEPIGNVVIQSEGEKQWVLIQPKYTRLLKPTLSPDGRAYFFANVDPHDTVSLANIPRYEFISKTNDVLWVPTWTWHRVNYLPDKVAITSSLFHFRPKQFISNNYAFGFLIIPNLIKEIVGLKTQ